MRRMILLLPLLCPPSPVEADTPTYPWLKPNTPITRRLSDIPPPVGFRRVETPSGTFAGWLRLIPLKPDGSPVMLHDGKRKTNQEAHVAVVDLDVGRADLQQCADAIIRLRAEYLWSRGATGSIGFHLTSGLWVPWSAWSGGSRVVVKGRSAHLAKTTSTDGSRPNFRQYLNVIFTYAGSASLQKEMKPRALKDLAAGDVLVQGGHPGHAVLVLDVARDEAGNRVMLLGQSYMPAQEFHVLDNPVQSGKSPWHRVSDLENGLVTAEWPYPFRERDIRTWVTASPSP